MRRHLTEGRSCKVLLQLFLTRLSSHHSTIAATPSIAPPTTPIRRPTARSALAVNKGSDGCAVAVDELFDVLVVDVDTVGTTGTTTELPVTLAVSVGAW